MNLRHRVEKLESRPSPQSHQQIIEQKQRDSEEAVRTVREALEKVGMVQRPDESLNSTLARALGPTACRELGGDLGEQLAMKCKRRGWDNSGPLSVARLDGDESVYFVPRELLNETRETARDTSPGVSLRD